MRGRVHLVEEKLPGGDRVEDVVKRYEISARTSGLIFREIIKDVQGEREYEGENLYEKAKGHEDYKEFLKWRSLQKEAGKEILSKSDVYRHVLEARRLDPLEMARLFVEKGQDKPSQYKEATELLKSKKLDHLIGVARIPGQTVEVRSEAKAALIEDWKKAYKESPFKGNSEDQSLLMMAYSNRDVRDLNERARYHLKASGDIGKEEFTYKISREIEDDFGRKTKLKEDRSFATGDRIVFTRNDGGLGVKNGSMGIILSLDKNKVEVRLDEGKTFGFSPNLFAFFDQGWAVTIHKSQGTTVGKSFLLASHEMNQNLTYVAMTRHRDDVQVYGSTCDFWREEKVSDVLSKSGEKLSAADYLDSYFLAQLMREEDHFISKLFTRLSDELHAMGAISKQAFKSVADHFLGRIPEDAPERALERRILLNPEVVREETRAQEILQKASPVKDRGPEHYGSYNDMHSGLEENLGQKHEVVTPTLQGVFEDMLHPAFNTASFIKKVFHEGVKLHGEEAAIGYWQEKRTPYMKLYEQKLETVDRELQSPLLNYLSDKSRNLARKAAREDPDKALNFLKDLQASKQKEQETKEMELHRSQQLTQKQFKERSSAFQESGKINENIFQKELRESSSGYLRFKELKEEIQSSPYDAGLKKEMHKLGREIFKDKEAFERIKSLDPEISQSIQKIAQHKKIEREFDRGRGGFSL